MMAEIKLRKRYPESREVDITDAYMRGYEVSLDQLRNLQAKDAKLRELLAYCHALLQCVCDAQDEHGEGCPMWLDRGGECDLREVERRMRELGVGVGE